jgi:hypothetical protein
LGYKKRGSWSTCPHILRFAHRACPLSPPPSGLPPPHSPGSQSVDYTKGGRGEGTPTFQPAPTLQLAWRVCPQRHNFTFTRVNFTLVNPAPSACGECHRDVKQAAETKPANLPYLQFTPSLRSGAGTLRFLFQAL